MLSADETGASSSSVGIRCGLRAGGFSTVRGMRRVVLMTPLAEDSDLMTLQCGAARDWVSPTRHTCADV